MYSFHHIGISNLHYGLYHILLRLSRDFLKFFDWRLISIGRNKGPNKQPLQALAYPSYLLKKDTEVTKSFLAVRTLICFQQASSLFPELSNNVKQTTTGGARCQNRTALLVPKTRVLPLHFILHITRPESESNRQPQIKCPPCTKRRPIVTIVLYH